MNYWKQLYTKTTTWQQLTPWLHERRFHGKQLVFTNGCFDILHRGHIEYLAQAASLGDELIIGLNSDDSVRRLKGPERPVNDQESRAVVLAALGFISKIVVFTEDTPARLIEAIQPDILVKGGDYTEESIVGADFVKQYGGRVEVIPFVQGFSTTQTINQMKQ